MFARKSLSYVLFRGLGGRGKFMSDILFLHVHYKIVGELPAAVLFFPVKTKGVRESNFWPFSGFLGYKIPFNVLPVVSRTLTIFNE